MYVPYISKGSKPIDWEPNRKFPGEVEKAHWSYALYLTACNGILCNFIPLGTANVDFINFEQCSGSPYTLEYVKISLINFKRTVPTAQLFTTTFADLMHFGVILSKRGSLSSLDFKHNTTTLCVHT